MLPPVRMPPMASRARCTRDFSPVPLKRFSSCQNLRVGVWGGVVDLMWWVVWVQGAVGVDEAERHAVRGLPGLSGLPALADDAGCWL